MKIIRWKAVIPITIILLVTVIFTRFFLDALTKIIMISVSQSIFGAKVEISELKTKLSNLSINIKGLQIADKSDEWKNTLEVENISFAMRFMPLLSKKVIVDEMRVDMIRWGTARKTSGKLPSAKLKKIEKEEKLNKDDTFSKLKDSIGSKAGVITQDMPLAKTLASMGDIKSISVSKLMGDTPLESLTAINTLSGDSKEKYDKYKTTVNQLNISEKVKLAQEIEAEISSIKITNNLQDLQAAQKTLADVNEKKKSIDTSVEELKTLRSSLSADFSDKQALTKQLNGLVDKDYKNLLAKVQIGKVDKGNVAQAVFGRTWYARVNKFLYYVEVARKYMPPRKKENTKAQIKRLKGTDIVFYKAEVLPGLLIKKIYISGTTGGEGKDNISAVTVQGTLTDVCSDPVLYGIPARLDIIGKNPSSRYTLAGVFDHTKDVAVDSVTVKLENYNTDDLNLGGGEYFPKIKKAKVLLNSDFALVSDQIDCKINIKLTELKLNKLQNDMLNELYSGLKDINTNIHLHGKIDGLQTDFDSNLDDVLVAKAKSMFDKKADELRAKIKAEVDKLVEGKKNELLKDYSQRREELLNAVEGKQAEVLEQKNKIDRMIQDKQKEIDDAADKEKKAKEEEVKKKIGPQEEELKKKLPPQFR